MSGALALLRPEVLALRPYVCAEPNRQMVRLHANEAPWQLADTPGLNRYPSPRPARLLDALAQIYELSPDQVLPTRGADDGIDLLVRAFCRPGQDAILYTPPTFGMYRFSADLQGAAKVPVLLDIDAPLSVETVVAAADARVKLVFLCSPNNPTGRVWQPQQVAELCLALRDRAIVAVDEAYAEFSTVSSATVLLPAHDNLVVLRTLSKAYALAGARCGSVLADAHLIEHLRRAMPPYPLPTPSIDAALDALRPRRLAQMAERIAALRVERGWLAARLDSLPAVRYVWPSEGNFLLVEVDDPLRFIGAGRAGGVLLRGFAGEPSLARHVRVTIGERAQHESLLAALESGQ